MRGYGRDGYDREEYEEDYLQDEYDDYGGEEEEEVEVRKPTKEEQDFLRLREELKERIRKNMKKESAKTLGNSQDKRKAMLNDNFGSFFGPSQPAIAQRVIEESRSIRETRHITAKLLSSSSGIKRNPASVTSATKSSMQYQKPKAVNEVKKKAQTLKDMRDYSFLLSDDADLPVPDKDQPAPRRVSNSNGPSVQAPLKSKPPVNKSMKPVHSGHEVRNLTSSNRPMHPKGGSVKEAPVNRSKLPGAAPRKVVQSSVGNGPGRPTVQKILPAMNPSQATATNRVPPKVVNGHSLERRPPTAKPHLSSQNHNAEHRRVSQGPYNKVLTTKKQPAMSLKHQPPKPIPSRGVPGECLKKRKPARPFSDDEDETAISMIRQMFRYDPRKFAGMDDEDDRDMEVGFDRILKEERRSAKIARKEDEEQLRLIEEEEARERMHKKAKLMQRG